MKRKRNKEQTKAEGGMKRAVVDRGRRRFGRPRAKSAGWLKRRRRRQ
jgi:hypothetical protein